MYTVYLYIEINVFDAALYSQHMSGYPMFKINQNFLAQYSKKN